MSGLNYIFCPFCGSIKWTVDKSRETPEGQVHYHKCQDCKKFSYVNIEIGTKSLSGLHVFERKPHHIVAEISSYKIVVYYSTNETTFENIETGDTVLTVKTAINFNWYKNEELIDKIKTYVVFS